MPLNSLTLDELRKLSDTMTSMVMAGFRLEQDGLAPIFDLTPNNPVRITLGAVMPATRAIEYRMLYDNQSTEAALPAVGAEPVDPPSVLGEVAEGGTISAEPSRSAETVAETPRAEAEVEAKAESGGGGEVAAPEAPAAPIPGSASALAATTLAPMWTPEEDERLIALVVAGVTEHGFSRNRALYEASRELGRTEKAVKFRGKTKLKNRIDSALTAAAMRQAQTETPANPAPATATDGPTASGEDAAAGGHSPAAVQADESLTAHLLGLTDKGGWSLQRDLDLMELSIMGWPPNEIATQLQMPDKAIKPRFDALTGLHDDEATGKKARRWTREEVLGALLVMAGKAEAA